MAIIGKSQEVPVRQAYQTLPKLEDNEVLLFRSRSGDELVHLAPTMVLSMMATAIGRNGSPVPASELVEIHNIGIFAAWDMGKKLGQLADDGYFTRAHVGIEEFFSPTDKFRAYAQETPYTIIKGSVEF